MTQTNNCTGYVPELFDFLRRLADNNDRRWFAEHKDEYDRLRKAWTADIARLLALMGQYDRRYSYLDPAKCIYRIYRDVRFSNDKSPYKTYFSAAFSPYGRQTTRACYYLHMSPHDDAGVYAGCWMPDSQMLRKIRTSIVDNIEEFDEIIHNRDFERTFPDWYGERLKTIPKGFDRNHPQADLLRQKEYGKFSHMTETDFTKGDWVAEVSKRFATAQPFVDFINYAIDEE